MRGPRNDQVRSLGVFSRNFSKRKQRRLVRLVWLRAGSWFHVVSMGHVKLMRRAGQLGQHDMHTDESIQHSTCTA